MVALEFNGLTPDRAAGGEAALQAAGKVLQLVAAAGEAGNHRHRLALPAGSFKPQHQCFHAAIVAYNEAHRVRGTGTEVSR